MTITSREGCFWFKLRTVSSRYYTGWLTHAQWAAHCGGGGGAGARTGRWLVATTTLRWCGHSGHSGGGGVVVLCVFLNTYTARCLGSVSARASPCQPQPRTAAGTMLAKIVVRNWPCTERPWYTSQQHNTTNSTVNGAHHHSTAAPPPQHSLFWADVKHSGDGAMTLDQIIWWMLPQGVIVN